MRSPRIAGMMLLAAAVAPRIARAQTTRALDPVAVEATPVAAPTPAVADDVIVLRSGAILRGRAAEVQPGSFARITLTDGAVRTVPWSEIASATGGSFAATASPAASSLEDRASYLTPGPGRVRVDVTSVPSLRTVGVTLRGIVARSSRGYGSIELTLCDTPCTIFVPPGPLRLRATRSDDTALHAAFDGDIPARGARLQIWRTEDLARVPATAEPRVLRASELARFYVQRFADQTRAHDRGVADAQIRTTLGGAIAVVGGLSIGGGAAALALGHCATSVFQPGCEVTSLGAVLLPIAIVSFFTGLGVLVWGASTTVPFPNPVTDPISVLLPAS